MTRHSLSPSLMWFVRIDPKESHPYRNAVFLWTYMLVFFCGKRVVCVLDGNEITINNDGAKCYFCGKKWQKRHFPIQKELLRYEKKTISIYRNSTFLHGCGLYNMVPPSGFSRCPLIVCFVVEKRNASF